MFLADESRGPDRFEHLGAMMIAPSECPQPEFRDIRIGSLSSFPAAVAAPEEKSDRGDEIRQERPFQAPLPQVVRQSGQPEHDGALPRALHELRIEARGVASGQAHHRHRAIGLGLVALQPPSPRARPSRARRHSRGRRHCLRVSGASDPGNRQAPDRRTGPQPVLSRTRGDPLRLLHRRRGADHRLRQDDARATDGGGDRRHPGDRAIRRADAQRLVPRRTHRLRHHRLEGARAPRGGRDQRRGIHRAGCLLGAVGGPLQYDGHRVDDELARRGAGHVAARRRGDSRAAQGSRGERLRIRQAHRRDGVGRPASVEDHDAGSLRERHRRQLGDRRLDERADSLQRDRAPHRSSSSTTTTGRRSGTTSRCS